MYLKTQLKAWHRYTQQTGLLWPVYFLGGRDVRTNN